LQLDAGDGAQQTQMAASHTVRIGNPITIQTFPKVFGFPYIEDYVGCVVHQINTGRFRQLPKKIASQPLDQRLRIRKQTKAAALPLPLSVDGLRSSVFR
jgi:hypothetical protein